MGVIPRNRSQQTARILKNTMAKAKEVKKVAKKDDRKDRWEAHLAAEKANNPSVYDTRGGDAQIENIPDSFK